MRAATKDLWKTIEHGQVPKNQFTSEFFTNTWSTVRKIFEQCSESNKPRKGTKL